MLAPVRIGSRLVGPTLPCFVIAEAGVNHNGDMHLAHRLIDAAAAAGADAVKFQAFVAEDLVTPTAPKAAYQVKTTGGPGAQYDMLKRLELNAEQQAALKAHAEEADLLYLCTPYDPASADLLDRMEVAAFKIASTDTNNVVFLRYLAAKGRPVILSTGMATLDEVEQGMATLKAGGLDGKIVLLHCVSEYPAPLDELNLRAIRTLEESFGCPVGFSDHSTGTDAGVWAVAAGACVVERHFTLDRTLPGPDHQASLEPHELAAMVRVIRQVEAALGDGVKRPMPSELANRSLVRKSVVAVRPIRAGETITADALACKRPGTGLAPEYFDRVVGSRAARDIGPGELLVLDAIRGND